MTIRKDRQTCYINSTLLSYLLTGLYPPTRRIIESLNSGVKELLDNNIVTKIKSDKINEYTINISNFNEKGTGKNYYTVVEEVNVETILKSNKTHCGVVSSLLRFYIYLLSTVHKKGSKQEGVGFTSLKDMADITDINEKTIRSYLKKLEKLNLIYVYRPKNSIIFNSGEIREITSTYGEYKNKGKIIQVGQEHENTYGTDIENQFKKVNRASLNKTRGLSQKYNHLNLCLLDGKDIPYSYDECKKIYLAMVEYNVKYEYRPERIKDLTVFSEFDFYNTE